MSVFLFVVFLVQDGEEATRHERSKGKGASTIKKVLKSKKIEYHASPRMVRVCCGVLWCAVMSWGVVIC